jgi:hypothetical protein
MPESPLPPPAATTIATATGTAASSSTSNAELDKITQQFVAEQPKLDTAVKNYLSYLSALRVSADTGDADGSGGPPSKVTTTHTLALSRYVLNGLNDSTLLPSPVEFGVRYPQPEAQTGLSRIDDLARYRVAYVLGAKLTAETRSKRTQFFGASFVGGGRHSTQSLGSPDSCSLTAGSLDRLPTYSLAQQLLLYPSLRHPHTLFSLVASLHSPRPPPHCVMRPPLRTPARHRSQLLCSDADMG